MCSALHPSERWLTDSVAAPLVAKFNNAYSAACVRETGSENWTQSSNYGTQSVMNQYLETRQ